MSGQPWVLYSEERFHRFLALLEEGRLVAILWIIQTHILVTTNGHQKSRPFSSLLFLSTGVTRVMILFAYIMSLFVLRFTCRQ